MQRVVPAQAFTLYTTEPTTCLGRLFHELQCVLLRLVLGYDKCAAKETLQ